MDFLALYDDFLTEDECSVYIEYFEKMASSGFTYGRKSLPHEIKDSQVFLHNFKSIRLEESRDICNIFFNKFWEVAYPIYIEKYSILQKFSTQIFYLKLQKSDIGDGYNTWHYENEDKLGDRRLLSFILYLNDVEDGGETEFLYGRERIKAKMGRLIIFPCGFTHTHRGNPPFTNSKYILTGWVEYS